jgi:hypothetical protein
MMRGDVRIFLSLKKSGGAGSANFRCHRIGRKGILKEHDGS